MSGAFRVDKHRHATLCQREAMLQFIEQHPELGNEKLSPHYDTYYKREKWVELTKILNKIPGRLKTPGKWQKTFQDWRYMTRKKAQQGTIKLNIMEQRLLNIVNNDEVHIPKFQKMFERVQPAAESTDDSWHSRPSEMEQAVNETEVGVEELDVKPHSISELFETTLIELNNKASTSQQTPAATSLPPSPPPANKPQRKPPNTNSTLKRKHRTRRPCSDKQHIRALTRCVRKSCEAVTQLCRAHAESSSKIAALLQENARTIQSLAESQMRQAEALERQVSLEESRNSLLKVIASSLSSSQRI